MVFDIKMEDFRRKACFVAGGHTTKLPKTSTYAIIVWCESVRVALMVAALNKVEVKAADIQNACITAPITEKMPWTLLGRKGKAIIVRALYGLKFPGAI